MTWSCRRRSTTTSRSRCAAALGSAELRRANLLGHTAGSASRTITVLSPKGGAGKTTMATNLAVALAERGTGSTALVDLDLQFGDVSAALAAGARAHAGRRRTGGHRDRHHDAQGLPQHPPFGALRAVRAGSPADADDISESARHRSGATPRRGDAVRGDRHRRRTRRGRPRGHRASRPTSSSSAPSTWSRVRSMRKEIDALDALGMTTQRRHLVVNRADNRVGLTVRDVEEVIGMEAVTTVPSSPSVALSMNSGSPVVEGDRRSPVARALMKLTEQFEPVGTADVSAAFLVEASTAMRLGDRLRTGGVAIPTPRRGAADTGDTAIRPVRDEDDLRRTDPLASLRAADPRDPVRPPGGPALRRLPVEQQLQAVRDAGDRPAHGRGGGTPVRSRAPGTRRRRSATTCSATGPSSASWPTTRSPRSWSTATDPIYVERNGKLHETTTRFISHDHLRRVIERIVSQVGRRIDESSPMVDARLPDGSRVNAIIPPLAVDGPVLTVRKFSREPYRVEDLVGSARSATNRSTCCRVRGGQAQRPRHRRHGHRARRRCSTCCPRSSRTTSGS